MASTRPVQHFHLRDFSFADGTQLPDVQVAFYDSGPAAGAPKTAVVFTCYRGRIHNTLTLADGALQGYRIIVIALFGNGESASPSNTAGFPATVGYGDCVRAQHALLTQHLGLAHVDVMMGFSMGGQTVYHWSVLHPGFAAQAVVLCSAARTSRHNYQFLEGPRSALESAVDYVVYKAAKEKGETGTTPRPVRGIRAFGKAYSAWLTSADWFEQERYRELGFASLAAWDEATTGSNYDGWDADDMLAMLGMWQQGDVTRCFGDASLEQALGRITARVLLMPCQTDQYFTWEASKREVPWLQDGTLAVIPSVWGHVAGSGLSKKDAAWIDQTVGEFLR